jgi:hypothetical protein
MEWSCNQDDQPSGAACGTGRFFWRHNLQAVRGSSDEGDLSCFGTIVVQGFEWCSHQPVMRTGRGRTEEDRAMRFGGSKRWRRKTVGKMSKEKKKKIKVIQNFCSDTMLRIRLYIESHIILYMRGLNI